MLTFDELISPGALMSECRDESLGRLIYFTAQEMTNLAEKLLRPYDLTLEQFHLLKNMDPAAGISQKRLGEVTSKTAANVTRMLDRLAAKDLVVRRNDPTDRRASLVSLTAKGKTQVAAVSGALAAYSAGILLGISGNEQQAVRKVLTKLTGNIRAMADDPAKNIKG
jgi:DNA-binding MarR family transcriptional regulator